MVPDGRRSVSGEELFARYAYPPNELGHCGPPGSETLFSEGAGGGGRSARDRAPQFEGAWAYLRLLAEAAGLDDPLAEEVVSAYWLGGDLLDLVAPEEVAALVRHDFGAQPGIRDRLASLPELAEAGPSHAFHVFVVYPWIGLLPRSTAGGGVPRSVLDSCRVRWGTVQSLDGATASVLARPLSWDGSRLGLGDERRETCRWARGSEAFVEDLAVGDQVTLHWDWICDRPDPQRLAALAERTNRQLSVTNSYLSRN